MSARIFPLRPDWGTPLDETWALLSSIFESDDGTEQRRAYRTIPTESWSMAVAVGGPGAVREAAVLQALLYLGPQVQWVLPYWPHETRLTAAVAAGAVVLPCATADRRFGVGGQAVLWRVTPATAADSGAIRTELVDVTGVTPSELQVSAVAADWPQGARVLPALRGRMAPALTGRRVGPLGSRVTVGFDLDVVTTYGVPGHSGEAES